MNAPVTFPATDTRFAINLENARLAAVAANDLLAALTASKGRYSTNAMHAEIAFTEAVESLFCTDNTAEHRENLRFELGLDKHGEPVDANGDLLVPVWPRGDA